MALFSVTVFVLFHFGLDRNEIDGSLASGVLWVTLLLATVLAVSRLFAAEREDAALDGILLAPIDRTAVYLAKAAALFLYLVLLELVALPELLAIVVLADVGLAGVGALVAGLAAETRLRELLVPLLLLPLLVPVLIASAKATKPLLMLNPAATDLGKWLGFMALYDMVFVLLAVAVFDFLLED
jgi:heme exporter protein B